MNILRVIVCAVLMSATSAHAHRAAQESNSAPVPVQANSGNGPERIAARQQAVASKPYLLSTNRWSELMLKDETVYLQLTDYGMKQVVQPEPKSARDSDEGILGNMIRALALSGVKELLDHSLALSLTDMRTAIVRDGEVVLVTCQGKQVFNKVKFNDQVQKFPQDQAEEFVNSVNRLRRRLPACRA